MGAAAPHPALRAPFSPQGEKGRKGAPSRPHPALALFRSTPTGRGNPAGSVKHAPAGTGCVCQSRIGADPGYTPCALPSEKAPE